MNEWKMLTNIAINKCALNCPVALKMHEYDRKQDGG